MIGPIELLLLALKGIVGRKSVDCLPLQNAGSPKNPLAILQAMSIHVLVWRELVLVLLPSFNFCFAAILIGFELGRDVVNVGSGFWEVLLGPFSKTPRP